MSEIEKVKEDYNHFKIQFIAQVIMLFVVTFVAFCMILSVKNKHKDFWKDQFCREVAANPEGNINNYSFCEETRKEISEFMSVVCAYPFREDDFCSEFFYQFQDEELE